MSTVVVSGGNSPGVSVSPGRQLSVIVSKDVPVSATGEDYLSLAGQNIIANPINLDNLSATGTPSLTKFLRGDNTWSEIDESTLDALSLQNAPAEAGADVTDATNVAAAGAVMDTGAQTVAGVKTFSSTPLVPDDAYESGWNGSTGVPTKNALYDKIEQLALSSHTHSFDNITAATLDNTFWTDGGTTARISKLADRVYIGAAVENDGTRPSGVSHGDDWYGQLAESASYIYNGVQAANGSDVNYAQLAVLADPDALPATILSPQIAILGSIMSENAITGASPRAGEFIAWNNPSTVGQTVPSWAIYIEAHRLTAQASNTYGIELAVRGLVSSATDWTPYTQGGVGLVGMQIQAGAGLPSTGQFNGTAALYISANPMEWGSGIVFKQGAVGAFGPGGTKPAIQLPYDHQVQWYHSGASTYSALRCGEFSNMFIDVGNGDLIVNADELTANSDLSVVGTSTFTGAATASSTLSVTGALTASSTASVTGAFTALSTAAVTGALTASSTATVSGTLTASGALNVAGTLTASGAVTAEEIVTLDKHVYHDNFYTILDDAVQSVASPYTGSLNEYFITCTNGTASQVPVGIFRLRASGAAFTESICVDTTNVNFTTGALTGTTGTDGKFTISADSTNIYFENRTGQTRVIKFWPLV